MPSIKNIYERLPKGGLFYGHISKEALNTTIAGNPIAPKGE